MSFRSITFKNGADRIDLAIGWDRPLQGFFMNAWRRSSSKPMSCIYDSLADDRTDAGYVLDLDHYVTALEKLGVQFPELLFDLVFFDRVFNQGSSHACHTHLVSAGGSFKGLSDVAGGAWISLPAERIPDLLRFEDDDGNCMASLPSDGSEASLRSLIGTSELRLPTEVGAAEGLLSKGAGRPQRPLHVYLGREWIASNDLDRPIRGRSV